MTTITRQMVLIADIQDDVELCMRADGLNKDTVTEYAAAMKDGAEFPPVDLKRVDGVLLLTNGFHRRAARKKIGATDIEALISDGTETDARLAAISADAHADKALRRTNADKRKAVMLALNTPEIADTKNDQAIANLAGVTN